MRHVRSSAMIMPQNAVWAGVPSIKGSTESSRMILLTFSLIGLQLCWGLEMTCKSILSRIKTRDSQNDHTHTPACSLRRRDGFELQLIQYIKRWYSIFAWTRFVKEQSIPCVDSRVCNLQTQYMNTWFSSHLILLSVHCQAWSLPQSLALLQIGRSQDGVDADLLWLPALFL